MITLSIDLPLYEIENEKYLGDAAPSNGWSSNPSSHAYISRNNGDSWTFFRENNLCSFQFLNETTGYALKKLDHAYSWEKEKVASTSYIFKTTDGGLTWNQASDQVLFADRTFFTDDGVGIARSYSVLQLTLDAGKTWHVLVYPIDEE